MTSIPARFHEIDDTLDSMVLQERPADAYYVWICDIYRRTTETIPGQLLEQKRRKYPMIEFRLSKDYGPLTKLRPALACEIDPQTLIVTADDEQQYHPAWLSGLVDSLISCKNGAVGYRGRRFRRNIFGRNLNYLESIVYKNLRSRRRTVDVLTGVAGAAYWRGMFDQDFCDDWDKLLSTDLPELFTNDDVWINAYLAKKNIRRYVTPVSAVLVHRDGPEALMHVNWASNAGSSGDDRNTYLIKSLIRNGWPL